MLPAIKSWGAREVVTHHTLNEQVRDVNSFLLAPPYAVLKRTTALKITGGSMQKVPWETADASGITVNKGNGVLPSLTVPQSGAYYASLSLCGRPSDVAHFMVDICVNGARELRGVTTAEDSGYQDTAYCAGTLHLRANDIITTEAYVTPNRTAVFTDGAWMTSASALQLLWRGTY